MEKKKYYYDKPGVKHTGLLRSGDDTYLFDKNGNLASGWNTVDGKDYYFDTVSGAAQKRMVLSNYPLVLCRR